MRIRNKKICWWQSGNLAIWYSAIWYFNLCNLKTLTIPILWILQFFNTANIDTATWVWQPRYFNLGYCWQLQHLDTVTSDWYCGYFNSSILQPWILKLGCGNQDTATLDTVGNFNTWILLLQTVILGHGKILDTGDLATEDWWRMIKLLYNYCLVSVLMLILGQ